MSKPALPPQRTHGGPIGQSITEMRDFLRRVHGQDHLWSNEVAVTFSAPSTPTRVVTGLNYPAKGYSVVRASADVRVFDAAAPSTETDRNALWLQASGAANVTLRIY